MRNLLKKIIAIALFLNIITVQAFAFSFSENEKQEQKSKAADVTMPELRKSCLTDKKIAAVIGEKHVQGWRQTSFGFSSIVNELNSHFRKFGLKTFTQNEITKQIAKAEQEAFLNNDIDAAVNAANRLGADLFLRGIISTKTQTNKFTGIDEVFITLSLSLVDRDGSSAASAQISDAAFSDADTTATVLKLAKEKAGAIITELNDNYCRQKNK